MTTTLSGAGTSRAAPRLTRSRSWGSRRSSSRHTARLPKRRLDARPAPSARPVGLFRLIRLLLSYMIIAMARPCDLSETIRRRRRELGLSLSQLARRIRSSPATVHRYESGWHRFELYTLQ
ncbi:MAG: helix-turn-helix domain-containing protein, partial [Spirochaetales bacterium]|nr:helix-turn-helix domain-containing protein [Spirochaetales bacterium]